MKLPFNILPWRRVALICAVTLLSVISGLATGAREQRLFDAAKDAMRDGFWERAETGFADFAEKYPKSELRADAILLQAQARFKQTNSAGVVGLLSENIAQAGFLADEYYFWIAEAQFQARNYAIAADGYAKILSRFPVSTRCLEACLGEATARAQLGQWTQVIGILTQPYGIFTETARQVPVVEPVLRGWLLLTEAYLNQGDAANAESTLNRLAGERLESALDWRRYYLQCRILVAQHREDDALQVSTNLALVAGMLNPGAQGELLAEGALFRSRIFEKLGRTNEAIIALQPNLAAGVPPAPQRQSLLKIAQLSLATGESATAQTNLQNFLTQYPNAPAVDMALVALGELELKDAVSRSVNSPNGMHDRTNRLSQPIARFDAALQNHPESSVAGRAQLDKGWCLWLGGDITNSRPLFEAATGRLPFSEEQATARFKWADTQLEMGDNAGALANYNQIIKDSARLPGIKGQWFELALYQTVRAGLKAGNLNAATDALRKIFEIYPNGLLGDHSLLLVGQGMMQQRDPARARALFEEFARQKPDTLSAEISLAVARTYELEGKWNAALEHYNGWLGAGYTNNADRAKAQYYRAWATFQAGDETNALIQLTNFLAQFPTNDLAPMAQWCVADHYFRAGEFLSAEKNYKSLFQTWPNSELASEAYLMAGRSAAGHLNFTGAIEYFTNLTSRLDCPPKLKTRALFAYGDALIQLEGTDTNRLANLELARQVYSQICQANPTNEQAVLAWGQIGNCYQQLAVQNPHYYTNALDAYVRVISSPYAGITARSQAAVGVGLVLEKEAQTKTGGEQLSLMKQALENYLNVVYGFNLQPGETRDLFWMKKAGLEAARLAESMQEWTQAVNLYRRLENLMPQLQGSFDKKIAKAQEAFLHGGN